MGGKASRDKGQRAEREFAKLIGGIRVPLSGAQEGYANDVIGLGLEWEVKRRKSGFKQLYEWLNDTRENPDAVALRTDNNDWVVCMKLDKFLKLIKEDNDV
jgi:Holliday junction resolvase